MKLRKRYLIAALLLVSTFSSILKAKEVGNEVSTPDGRAYSLAVNPCEERNSWQSFLERQSQINHHVENFFLFVEKVSPILYSELNQHSENIIVCETAHDIDQLLSGLKHPKEKRIAFFWPKAEGSKDLLLIDKKRFYSNKITNSERAATLFREQLHSLFPGKTDSDETKKQIIEWQKHNLVNAFHREYLSQTPNYRYLTDMLEEYQIGHRLENKTLLHYCDFDREESLCLRLFDIVNQYNTQQMASIMFSALNAMIHNCDLDNFNICELWKHRYMFLVNKFENIDSKYSNVSFRLRIGELLYIDNKERNAQNKEKLLEMLDGFSLLPADTKIYFNYCVEIGVYCSPLSDKAEYPNLLLYGSIDTSDLIAYMQEGFGDSLEDLIQLFQTLVANGILSPKDFSLRLNGTYLQWDVVRMVTVYRKSNVLEDVLKLKKAFDEIGIIIEQGNIRNLTSYENENTSLSTRMQLLNRFPDLFKAYSYHAVYLDFLPKNRSELNDSVKYQNVLWVAELVKRGFITDNPRISNSKYRLNDVFKKYKATKHLAKR